MSDPIYNKPKHQKSGRRGFLNQRAVEGNVPIAELAIVLTLVICFYGVASNFDLNEKWIEWAEDYEHIELDELPLGFGAIALGLAWFSWRRWVEIRKSHLELSRTQESLLVEINHREQAEKVQADIRLQLENNIRLQKQRTEQIRAVQEMGDLLIFAEEKSEIFTIAVRYAKKIIPFSSGAIYEYRNNTLKYIHGWGILAKHPFNTSEGYKCWAIRQGKPYTEAILSSEKPLCSHAVASQCILCVPIITPRGIWGIFHFRQNDRSSNSDNFSELEFAELEKLAKTIADNLSLHIHNLFLKEQLTLESIKDPLTGILNRRGLSKVIEETELLQNPQCPFSILIFDIDHFKKFNDQYGHNGGDAALVCVASLINTLIRDQDMFCRYGGEEFVLILKNTDKSTAFSRAESIRQSIAQQTLNLGNNQFANVTISVGIATYPNDSDKYEMLIKLADKALYKAKDIGRNRVVDCRD